MLGWDPASTWSSHPTGGISTDGIQGLYTPLGPALGSPAWLGAGVFPSQPNLGPGSPWGGLLQDGHSLILPRENKMGYCPHCRECRHKYSMFREGEEGSGEQEGKGEGSRRKAQSPKRECAKGMCIGNLGGHTHWASLSRDSSLAPKLS